MPTSRFEALARRLVFVLGLGAGGGAACDANEPLPADPAPAGPSAPAASQPVAVTSTPAAAPLDSLARLEAEVEADLAHLRSLNIAEVRGLVLHLPDRATWCYGPCSDSAWETIKKREYTRQLPRLHALRNTADETMTNTVPAPAELRFVEGDLAFLNGLEIVELGDLLRSQPANNPSCYNTPCAEDLQKAKTETAYHAFYLHAWAGFASREKP